MDKTVENEGKRSSPMKGRTINAYGLFDLIDKAFASVETVSLYPYKDRVVNNTKGKLWVVDTVYVPYNDCWETGCRHKYINDNLWVITDEYDSLNEARLGHSKWVKYMKTKPSELWDVHIKQTFKLLTPNNG